MNKKNTINNVYTANTVNDAYTLNIVFTALGEYHKYSKYRKHCKNTEKFCTAILHCNSALKFCAAFLCRRISVLLPFCAVFLSQISAPQYYYAAFLRRNFEPHFCVAILRRNFHNDK